MDLENTYNAPIELNRFDWQRAYVYSELRRYYQGLIALRKQLPGLCDKSGHAGDRIYDEWTKPGVVGFFVDNCKEENSTTWKSVSRWKRLCVIYNKYRMQLWKKSCPVAHGKHCLMGKVVFSEGIYLRKEGCRSAA